MYHLKHGTTYAEHYAHGSLYIGLGKRHASFKFNGIIIQYIIPGRWASLIIRSLFNISPRLPRPRQTQWMNGIYIYIYIPMESERKIMLWGGGGGAAQTFEAGGGSCEVLVPPPPPSKHPGAAPAWT